MYQLEDIFCPQLYRVEMTLVFDVWINDKFLDKDQSFQDTLCHKHYNIFSHSEKNSKYLKEIEKFEILFQLHFLT
jgi:hypothetical protein